MPMTPQMPAGLAGAPMPVAQSPEALYEGLGAPAPAQALPQAPAPAQAPQGQAPEEAHLGRQGEESVRVSEEQALDSDLEGWIDPELLGVLKQRARGEPVSWSEAIGIAGLGITNPQLAQQLIANKAEDMRSARGLLTALQTHAQDFRRNGVLQRGIYDRTLLTQRGAQVKEILDAANSAGVEVAPPPGDLLQDAPYAAWYAGAQSAAAKGQKAKARSGEVLKIGQATTEEARRLARAGADPSTITPDWFKAQLGLQGVTAEELQGLEGSGALQALAGAASSAAAMERTQREEELKGARVKTAAALAGIDRANQYLDIARKNANTREAATALEAVTAADSVVARMEASIPNLTFMMDDAIKNNRPEVARMYREAAANLIQHSATVTAESNVLRQQAMGHLGTKEIALVYQQSLLEASAGFLQNYPTFAKDEASLHDWLHQHPDHPAAWWFWDNVRDGMILQYGPGAKQELERYIDGVGRITLGAREDEDVVRKYGNTITPPQNPGQAPPLQ